MTGKKRTTQGPGDRAEASPDPFNTFQDEELRLVTDSITEYAIVAFDLDGRITGWNVGAERVIGYAASEILGHSGEIFFTPEDRAAGVLQREFKLAREEGRASDERWHLKKDESRFWGSGVTLPVGRDNLRGYIKIFRDRTEERRTLEQLRGRTRELETVLQTVPLAVWFTHDAEGRTITGNPPADALLHMLELGRPPEDLGEPYPHLSAYVGGVEIARTDLPIRRAARGEEVRDEEMEVRFHDGRVVTLLAQATPLRDDKGRVVGAVSAATDISYRKRIEKELEESELKFRQLADNIPAIAWMAEPDGRVFWFNRRWYEYTGSTPDETPEFSWRSRHDPNILPTVLERWNASLTHGTNFEMTFPIKGADGVYREFLTRMLPLRDGDGRISRWFGVNFDVSEHKTAERHQQLLINELNHRVKNTLATVQSIASQTFRGDTTDARARHVFEERLIALARAHDVLTRENWEGASLRDIVTEATAAHRDIGERFELSGPELRVSPRMALTLAMALHELATNAVKYGALSMATGRVVIVWSVSDETVPRRLRLRWEERGGPPVRAPQRRGFGSRLIERALARDLSGEVRIDYAPGGVACTIDAPMVDAPDDPPAGRSAQPSC